MALTKSTLPAITPTIAVPYDTLQAFSLAETITASAYASNVNTQLHIGPGRFTGLWTVNITAVNVATSDEKYQFFLLGSNDAAFANGNVEILAAYDLAATAALRLLATICAASPTAPPTGESAQRVVRPWLNQVGDFVFQYMQLYVLTAGTGPSVTFSSWLSENTMNCD